MIGYFDVFPEKSKTELRTAYFPDEPDEVDLTIPSGTYLFTEYYCPDLSCDCQRLLVKVFHSSDPRSVPDEVATFNYSWNESSDDLWKNVIPEFSNPFLDPFHHQAEFASELMEFWYSMVCHDHDYCDRLKKHYSELRTVHGESGQSPLREGGLDFTVDQVVAEKKRRFRTLRKRQQKRRGRRRSK